MVWFWRWFLVTNWFAKLIHHKALMIIGGPVVGFYVSIVKLSSVPAVSHYKAEHDITLAIIILLGCLWGIHAGFRELIMTRERKAFEKLFSGINAFANNVVRIKRERFSSALAKLKKKNVFNQITKPEIQISSIAKGAARLFCEAFEIKEEDLDITIIAFSPLKENGYYMFRLQDQVRHAHPSVLTSNKKSTAYRCLETGTPCFFPDKNVAFKEGQYAVSRRDSTPPSGSIYCHPFFVPLDESGRGREFKFLINVVTYKKQLCPSSDPKSTDAALIIMKEVTTRLELELSLHCIKEWSDNPQSTQSLKVG